VKPRASFLLVRVRLQGWPVSLVVPVPLFVLEDALEAIALLFRVLGWAGVRPAGRWAAGLPADLWRHGAALPAALLRELRGQGRLTLAEVQDGATQVSVRLV